MSFLRRVLDRALFSPRTFEFLQKHGVHLLYKDFYSPIPDTKELTQRRGVWDRESELPGLDLNVPKQLDLLENVFPAYRAECDFPLSSSGIPWEYYINNGAFGLLSAAVLHCMIRHWLPNTIMEVGSGNSTYVSARASLLNAANGHPAKLVAIDPYPNEVLQGGFPGLAELLPTKLETLDLARFTRLQSGDILFIDSSHVVRLGGDVNFLYLEVLPRLQPGVVVHIHDIFFPREYPRAWVIQNRSFWTEQYLLQAFLTFNREFEVLWCGSYIYLKHLDRLTSAFPPPPGLGIAENYFSSSFWMRRRGA